MAFEKVWEVYQLGDYAVIEGMVTDEERDVLVMRRVAGKYQLVTRYIPFAPKSTDGIRATLQQAPNAPPALILYIDLSRFVQ